MNLKFELTKTILSYGVATGQLVAGSIRDNLIYTFQQWNEDEDRELYNAKFGDIEKIAIETGKGWTVNGKLFLKNIENTNRHYAVFGNTGSFKSTTIVSQLLNASGQCFLIHDPSGNLANISARYLQRKGYRVFLLDFNDPDYSCGINLLDFITCESDAGKLASHLVRNSLGDKASDPFWTISSVSILRLLICAVLKLEPKFRTMKNVQQLLFALAAKKQDLKPIVVKSLSDTQFAEFVSLVKGNEKTLSSIIMTCQAALELFNNESVARITSQSTIRFEDFRKQPTALFIKNSTLDATFIRPILSVVIENAIKVFMNRLPQPGERQVLLILDECSTLKLDSLELVLANARKNNIGFCCMYQHPGQVISHLGKDAGASLLSNCYSKLFLTSDLDTSKHLEDLLGRRTITDEKGRTKTEPLLPAQRIRSLKTNEGIFLHGALPPFKLKIYPYFEQHYLRLRASDEEYRGDENAIPKTPAILKLQ
jgi:type IV secretory pathway TraG/TraD family ATPase VirD4